VRGLCDKVQSLKKKQKKKRKARVQGLVVKEKKGEKWSEGWRCLCLREAKGLRAGMLWNIGVAFYEKKAKRTAVLTLEGLEWVIELS
jgi:hypothetical protein